MPAAPTLTHRPAAVLHLTRDFPPGGQGGVSIAVAALRAQLAATGAAQAVLSFDGWRPSRGPARQRTAPLVATPDAFGPVHRLSAPATLAEAERVAIAWLRDRIAAGERPIVLLHADLLAEFGVALAHAAGAEFAVYAHVLQAAQRRLHGLAEPTASEVAQYAALAAATVVFAPSEWAAAQLREVSAAPVAVWPPLAARVDLRSAGATDRSDAPTLLYLGRFDATKGFDVLLAALPAVLRAHPGVHVHLAGGLPHAPKSERRWRRKVAAALGEGRAAFPGFLAHQAALEALASADVVVIPSRIETFGLVAEEAMLAGRCVVATTGGALSERLHDGVDALLVPPDDAAALAEALLRALADDALRMRLGDAARAGATRRAVEAAIPPFFAAASSRSPAA